ncbi:MAG: hypothetical protein JO044_14125 [Mycobacteriaceae bacterium]|nr:hypothetical protein [Mycobacteriaceae bacterium]MBV9639218.1 hypothetical protein [Mycobacteriaceae bacterium]
MAEEAEAEAAEADALAAAARARARAIRLRRQAASAEDPAEGGATAAATATEVVPAPAEKDAGDDAQGTHDGHAEGADGGAADGADGADVAEGEVTGAAVTEAKRSWRRVPSRRVLARVALGVTIGLICALLAASGSMVWQHRSAAAERHRSAEFAAAARQGVVSLMTLDFNHAKADVQRVLDNSTGEFRDDFQSRADDFTKVVQDSKVITKGTVNATAVQSMHGDSAVVLVAAASQVTNATGAQNEPRAWRLSVTVQRDGGQIKMSKVVFVP